MRYIHTLCSFERYFCSCFVMAANVGLSKGFSLQQELINVYLQTRGYFVILKTVFDTDCITFIN